MFTEIPLGLFSGEKAETDSVDKRLVAYRASGKLTDDDYQTFLPVLKQRIRDYGSISLLIEFKEFEGWEPKAAWDDFRFGMDYQAAFSRIAVIGESAWQRWMMSLSSYFVSAEMRYFEAGEDVLAEAVNWLQSSPQAALDIEAEPAEYEHVLLATDFSAHSDLASKRALSLARRYGARLSVVSVVDYLPFYPGEVGVIPVDSQETWELIEARVQHQLDTLVESLRVSIASRADAGNEAGEVELQHELLTGSPQGTIVAWARQHDVDLIVLGSHGHRGLARLLGSVANGVMQTADCDVLTVRL